MSEESEFESTQPMEDLIRTNGEPNNQELAQRPTPFNISDEDEFQMLVEGLSSTTVQRYRQCWCQFTHFVRQWVLEHANIDVSTNDKDTTPAKPSNAQIVAICQTAFRGGAPTALDPVISAYMSSLGNLRAQTHNIHRAAILLLNKFAMRRGWCDWRMTVHIRPAKVSKRHVSGPTIENVNVLLEHYDNQLDDAGSTPTPAQIRTLRYKAITLLMVTSGLRISEALNIRTVDFKYRNKTVSFVAKGHVDPTTVEISLTAAVAIREWLSASQTRCQYLFGSTATSTVRSHYSVMKKRFGAKYHPHGFRHTAITTVLEANNGNIMETAVFSRHADPKTLMVYNDKRLGVQRKGADAVAGRLNV